jgi:ribosomal-protein-alanine N-acetyltransferase
MPQTKLILPGERINLRPVRQSDAVDIYQGARNHAISRYTFIPRPYRMDDAVSFIHRTHVIRRKKKGYAFGIEHKESGRIIGMCSVFSIFENHRRGEVGYWVNKKYWGQGYATEALELILKFCFNELKLHRVVAGAFSPNKVSQQMLEKAGFKREGYLRQHAKVRGRWMDLIFYGMLATEYRARRKKKRQR